MKEEGYHVTFDADEYLVERPRTCVNESIVDDSIVHIPKLRAQHTTSVDPFVIRTIKLQPFMSSTCVSTCACI
jgi:hypothetical protein